MPWPGIHAIEDSQASLFERGEKLGARPQTQVLRQVGQDEPAFAARNEMRGQAAQETEQHAAVLVVDGRLDGRARPGGQPRGIADDERRATLREQIGIHHLNLLGDTETRDVVACASESARVPVGRDDDIAPLRASTAASTPVPVPMSNATKGFCPVAGSGAAATSPTYSPRTGENTPKCA